MQTKIEQIQFFFCKSYVPRPYRAGSMHCNRRKDRKFNFLKARRWSCQQICRLYQKSDVGRGCSPEDARSQLRQDGLGLPVDGHHHRRALVGLSPPHPHPLLALRAPNKKLRVLRPKGRWVRRGWRAPGGGGGGRGCGQSWGGGLAREV